MMAGAHVADEAPTRRWNTRGPPQATAIMFICVHPCKKPPEQPDKRPTGARGADAAEAPNGRRYRGRRPQKFILYLVHAIIRYLIGSIILKLSVTSSQYVRQLRGTSSRKNASMAMLKSLKLG